MASSTKVKLNYSGSMFWLIFWLLIFFPVGLVLLATSSAFNYEGKEYSIRYDGSKGWLCFWTICFFPVALILLLLNGFSINVHQLSALNP